MAKNDKALAVTADQEKALAMAQEYAEYAGGGFENQTGDDYKLPLLKVLQPISPELNDNTDLKQGQIYNPVTGDAFDGKTGIVFVPAVTKHEFIEFVPRSAGGGYVGVHEIGSDLVCDCVAKQPFGAYKSPAGNDLTETFSVFGIQVLPDSSHVECVIAFTKSKVKKYKAWMSKAKTIQIALPEGRRIPAPLFAHRYRLTTVQEKNNLGTFYNWNVTFDGADALAARLPTTDAAFQSAVAIRGLLADGKARAAYETAAEPERAVGEKEIPF